MSEKDAYLHERKRMVDQQMVRRGIRDERLLEAILAIPRHEFVPPEQVRLAYIDAPLPIGNNQTISQPYIVALMTELLYLKGDETVLEIGTGSGYQTAILAHLAKKVYSIERIPELAERARFLLHSLMLDNIEVVVGDGSCGLPEHAPYQAIIVTAAAPEVPKPLEDQLSDSGRLVVPVGSRAGQVLELWKREGQKLVCEKLAPVAFVPLIGAHAWSPEGKSQRK
ncbi:MAG: protein-L-isoaspartate(D-aspartate) O-methyltransferase [Anaerolineales bacterium]|nr:protein-L-isoaspartate(D-aspartate) O-methyltransferase [Anaerolineales bacterium]